jgi:hypothetical protein
MSSCDAQPDHRAGRMVGSACPECSRTGDASRHGRRGLMRGGEVVEPSLAADANDSDPIGEKTPLLREVVQRIRNMGRVGRGFAAFLMYATISGALYVQGVFAHLGSWCVGWCGPDTSVYLWSLRWMPFALSHGLNPLYTTHYLWAPGGANLVWVTTLPGPAFLLTPATAIWGPLVSNNLILWLAPALAGWACYLLCGQLTSRFWPAWAGGVIFGFSTYVGHHVRGHVNLMLMFCVPLAAYLVVRRVRGRIGSRAFVALLAVALVGQFSISTEIFVTMTFFGGLALLLALACSSGEVRRAVWSTAGLVAIAYAIVLVVVSPYVLEVFRSRPSGALRPLDANSVDLLSWVLPRPPTWLGADIFRSTTEGFRGLAYDDTAYMGLALLLVVALFAWFGRRSRWTWMLIACLLGPVAFSFGPTVRLAGRPLFPGPGAILARLPVVSSALPERFPLFAWLAMAVIGCLFLSEGRSRFPWRWALVGVGLLTVAVALPSPPYRTPLTMPSFFADGTYRGYLEQGETDLVLPAQLGDEMLWQQAADFWFRQAKGYIGFAQPNDVERSRLSESHVPSPAHVMRYLDRHDVAGVILPFPPPPAWDELFSTIGVRGTAVGGVTLYRAPLGGWPTTR